MQKGLELTEKVPGQGHILFIFLPPRASIVPGILQNFVERLKNKRKCVDYLLI